MVECKDCIHYGICQAYVDPNEDFAEVGGCDCFKPKNIFYKIGYYIGLGIGFVKKLIKERREQQITVPKSSLRNCPYCGSKPIYRGCSYGHHIACENQQCPIQPETFWYGYFELAEEAWNIRAN